ncbi:hypothetical protein HRbin15_01130 [bacterium HR15]|nr:hypothetical protein HRbin15_01130 [bacterium HR15]
MITFYVKIIGRIEQAIYLFTGKFSNQDSFLLIISFNFDPEGVLNGLFLYSLPMWW